MTKKKEISFDSMSKMCKHRKSEFDMINLVEKNYCAYDGVYDPAHVCHSGTCFMWEQMS